MPIQDLGYKGFTSSGMKFRPNESGIGTAKQVLPRPGNNMVGGLLGAGVDLAQNAYNNKVNSQNIANNQQMWKNQIAAARPGNITGGDVETYYDPETNTIKTKQSDQLQGMLAGLYGQTGGYSNQLANLNPYELADHMYNQNAEARNLTQDREKAQILEMMNARGLNTSTTGNNLFGSTVQNQNLANAQERSGYMTQAQNIANAIADRQNAAISNIYGADSMTQQNIQNAINMGVNVPPPDTLGSAYQSQADSKQSFGEGVGSSLSSMLGLATGAGSGIAGLLGGISKLF